MNNRLSSEKVPNEWENELLSKFILGNASEAEIAQLQEAAESSPALRDAMEGLQDFDKASNIPILTQQINQQLARYTQKKKISRIKKNMPDTFWPIVAILLTLTLAIIAFVLIRANLTAN